MKKVIDRLGRIVIPKVFRTQMGLTEGTPVCFHCDPVSGALIVEKAREACILCMTEMIWLELKTVSTCARIGLKCLNKNKIPFNRMGFLSHQIFREYSLGGRFPFLFVIQLEFFLPGAGEPPCGKEDGSA